MNKKKIFGSIAVLAITALTAFNVSINTQEDGLSNISLNDVEALAGESGYCENGGKGSTSCSIAAGVEIAGGGVTSGCSVSCTSGYYACCTLRCVCEEI
jgi:hypothetical protein